MSRPRAPQAVRALRGDTRPSRQFIEPQPRKEPPELPAWLTPTQRQHWHWARTELEAMGCWYSADAMAVANLCVALATVQECNVILANEGLLCEGQKGNTVRHPLTVVRNQAQLAAKGLLAELGLSPRGRAQLPARPPTSDDRLEYLLNGVHDPHDPSRLLG